MTILDTREIQAAPAAQPRRRRVEPSRRPRSQRPGGAPLRYRGPGVTMSRAGHRRRPITPGTTVLLALVAAGITVWLGLVAQFGGVVGADPAPTPDRLAVVQVQMGESLHQVAQRVAPDAPVSQVVEQIRELNHLDTAALDAGQTLIAPVG
ncbi:LysM domain-containing protein [Mycolicibacterium rutilum]|uniref:LysM domain-containing protein n=1 Tax=Mycolicibacterium rutilum TaxID=370526 RepID=A0A1H6L6M6_MYCRU|nr:LysM peptidoglycan-binding domain-containing protein [Mycolicibacterium rutilum]SEH84035.1 LysM domain-containing protein [Mycolicibacterium rutilum]